MSRKRGPYNTYEFKGSKNSVPRSSAHVANHPQPPKKRKKNKAEIPPRSARPPSPLQPNRQLTTSTNVPSQNIELQSLEPSSSRDEWQFVQDVHDVPNEPCDDEPSPSRDEWQFVQDVHGVPNDVPNEPCDDEESLHFSFDEDSLIQHPTHNPDPNDPDPDDDIDDELATATNLHLSVPEKIKVLLLLATKLRHNLTYPAAECVMRLAGVLSKGNVFSPSKHILKNAISFYSASLAEHHVCPCGFYIGVINESKQCDKCHNEIDAISNKKKGNLFLYLSVAEQIEFILKNGLAGEIIDSQHRQKINPGNYEDIPDGEMYKRLVALNCLSFNFFVDGVQVGTTTKKSAWPILISLNELPLHLRRKHVLMASVWLGKGKPDMNQYLKPFIKECIQLQREGISIKINGLVKTYRIVPLMCVSDSIARPLLRNSSQFNGSYGCGLCYHPGYNMRRGRGHCRSYTIADREFPRRTHEETLEFARSAIARRETQHGIKGPSILTDIPGFDIVNCLDLDLFHALVNCAKRFTNLLLSPKYSTKRFNVSNKFAEVDQRLLSITPTDAVSRAPRSLNDRSNYRGHEWFHWVVFYSIPVMAGILPQRFLDHWSLLVHALVLLMQNSVSKSEVVYAGRYLRQFNIQIDALYGPQHIKSAVHSSNGVAHQISKQMQLRIALKSMKNDLEFAMCDREKDYLESVMTAANPLVDPHLTIQDVDFLGTPKTVLLAPNLHRAILREGIEAVLHHEYLMFDRCAVNNEVFQSVAYSKAEKQNNSTVLLSDNRVFEIHSFIIVDNLGLALGHYLVANRRRLCCNDIPHMKVFNENVEDTLRCIPISSFEMKLLSFSMNISDSALRFTCVNVLQMEMLH